MSSTSTKKMSKAHIKRLQQFVNVRSGYKIRVTQVKRSDDPIVRKFDLCVIYNLNDNGTVNKSTARTVYADSIRRRYVKA